MSTWIKCLCLCLYTMELLNDKSEGHKWNVWSVVWKTACFFICCYFFVGVRSDCDIKPHASGLWGLSWGAVITQQGAYLRQPCLLSEPMEQTWSLGEHRTVGPMMHRTSLFRLGNNKQVTCCTLHLQSLHTVFVFFPSLYLLYMLNERHSAMVPSLWTM